MRFKFIFGAGPPPAFVVYRQWISVYMRSTDPLKMRTMDDFIVAIFPKSVRSRFGY